MGGAPVPLRRAAEIVLGTALRITSRYLFAPHHDPLPRYSLRGGGEEANDEVISEPFLTRRMGTLARLPARDRQAGPFCGHPTFPPRSKLAERSTTTTAANFRCRINLPRESGGVNFPQVVTAGPTPRAPVDRAAKALLALTFLQ